MPAVELLYEKSCKIRQSRKQGHSQVALTGKALQNGGEPESTAVISRQREKVGKRQQQNVAVPSCLPEGVGTTLLLGLIFPAQLLGHTVSLLAPQTARLAMPVRAIDGRVCPNPD